MPSPLAHILEHGLVAVIDVPVQGDQVLEWAMAVSKGGIKILGVPVNLDNVTEVVSDLADEADLLVGISHVVEPEQVSVAVAAGARFVIAPIADPAVIEAAKSRGLIVVAGAMTPTEVRTARDAGADMVSLHPVGALGKGAEILLEAVLHNFPGFPIAVAGHVDVENGPTLLERGACAAFVDRGVFPDSSESEATGIITMRAAALAEVCGEALGTPSLMSIDEIHESQQTIDPRAVAAMMDRPAASSEEVAFEDFLEGESTPQAVFDDLLEPVPLSEAPPVYGRPDEAAETTVAPPLPAPGESPSKKQGAAQRTSLLDDDALFGDLGEDGAQALDGSEFGAAQARRAPPPVPPRRRSTPKSDAEREKS